MRQEHMPIFVSYIKEFAGANQNKSTLVNTEQLKQLREQGDWTKVSYYILKKNVTLEDPEMLEYKTQIDAILE
jgi:hypothetical protein